MTRTDATDALRRAAAIGPYFAVDLDDLDGPGWLPFTDLLHDPTVVAERIGVVGAALAVRTGLPVSDLDERACASIHFLGLVSRLVAPPLAAAVLTGVVPATSAAALRWQRTDGGPVPIAWTAGAAHRADDPEHAAGLLHEHVVGPLVTPLVRAFGQVSCTVLWGNVASALTGATSMLLRSEEPFMLDPMAVTGSLLAHGPLSGTGTFDVPDRFFIRNSCCLFYRIPNAGKCGDCVLL